MRHLVWYGMVWFKDQFGRKEKTTTLFLNLVALKGSKEYYVTFGEFRNILSR